MKVNESQQMAITTINRNLALNAGAGTGKTKVLTERYVYILEHGNLVENKEIESIVAITFTKKATQEMIQRIRLEVKKNFHKGDKWRRYYRDLEQANISTIHSFCGKLLRENPIEANIDPMFQVLEDDKAGKLLKSSIIHVLNKSLEENNKFLKLMNDFGVNRIENLVDDFYSVYNSIRTVGVDFELVKWMTLENLQELKVDKRDINNIKERINCLVNKISKNSLLYKMVKNGDPIWQKFMTDDYAEEDLYRVIEHIGSNLGTSTKEVEHFQSIKNSMGNILKTKDLLYKDLYSSILELLISIDNKYMEEKKDLSVLDYDDLQIQVLKLLDKKDIREYYQNKFKYFMIDEFQDTNELQRKIFYKLTSVTEALDQSNLFIVGDPKQSIYGFRGSDIDVFYDTIKDISYTTNEKPITMNINYRTNHGVLDFINNIFTPIMGEKYESLIAHKIKAESIDVEILENSDFINYPELEDSGASTIYEADLIAKRIKILVDEKKFNYRDFAMLFRSTSRTYIYEEALKNYNIPYFNTSSKRYFYRQEILDIINALKVISNPYDNIATIGFLRSPMVGISDNSLYYILKNKKENKSLFHSMCELEDRAIEKEDISKIEEAGQLLNYFHEIKETSTISELAADLIEKTYFVETLLLKINGRQSLANIYKFIEMVELYEQNNKNSLEDFIDYIEEIKVRDEPEAPMESETSNVIKLLTIHKSKGLEFPVVIIPEMARDTGGRFPNLLFNKDLGLGLKTISCSGFHDEIKDILRVKENEEKERVLYVAMTRAEKMLILGNQGKNRGFKKLTAELLDKNKYKVTSHINLEQESTNKIKTIEEHLLKGSKNNDIKKLPLLFHVNLNKKSDSYSISQYLVFKQCKRKYYLDFYHGRTEAFGSKEEREELEINPLEITALDKGNIVHEFAQLYNPAKNVSDLLNSIILSLGLSNEEENLKILLPYINNYLKLYRDDYDTVFLEKAFHIKIGDNYLNGVIDRINIKDNRVEILDFKTNKVIDKDKLIKQYTPQLQLYAYAVEKIMNIKVRKASIVFLETGQVINVALEKEQLLANIDSIGKFIHFVENHNDIIDYSKSTSCNYCNYKTICF